MVGHHLGPVGRRALADDQGSQRGGMSTLGTEGKINTTSSLASGIQLDTVCRKTLAHTKNNTKRVTHTDIQLF